MTKRGCPTWTPVFDRCGIRLFHADCRDVPEVGDVTITDPPYGYRYESGQQSPMARSIAGDDREWWDVVLRTSASAVCGVWHRPPPTKPRAVLVWDKGPASGMGDLTVPWKPNWELVWVFGKGWTGKRTTGVIQATQVAQVSFGRIHPTEKPVALLTEIIQKAPPGLICDPFAGSASTLVAAMRLGREAVGMEIDEQWILAALARLHREADAIESQGRLFA